MEPNHDPAYGFEFAPPRRPIAWVTCALAASTVGVWLVQLFELHWHHGVDVVGNFLACSRQSLHDGRYYTLLTYAWAHAVDLGEGVARNFFWLHIFANMLPLVFLGPALEEILGHWRYLCLYLGGAIVSVLVWLYFNSGSNEPIIGASGAVFAVIAGIGTAVPRARVTVYVLYVLPVRMSMSAVAIVACGVEVLSIIFNWLPDVAHSAHLGGAAFGAFFTWLVLPRNRYA